MKTFLIILLIILALVAVYFGVIIPGRQAKEKNDRVLDNEVKNRYISPKP